MWFASKRFYKFYIFALKKVFSPKAYCSWMPQPFWGTQNGQEFTKNTHHSWSNYSRVSPASQMAQYFDIQVGKKKT